MFEAPPEALRTGVDDFGAAAIAVVIVGVTAVGAQPPRRRCPSSGGRT